MSAAEEPEEVDLITLQCRRIVGIPAWRWYEVRAVENGMLVHGAVCEVLYKSGSRKGSRNWAKRDMKTDRTVIISHDDKAKFIAQWEDETGKCSKCLGSGKQFAAWNHERGTTYAPCTRCSATGRVKAA